MKALQFYDTNETAVNYNSAVYVWDTVHGVRSMTFGSFMNKALLPAHEYDIELRRIGELNSELVKKEYEYLRTIAFDRDNIDIRIQMAFRTLWHYATGEVIDM